MTRTTKNLFLLSAMFAVTVVKAQTEDKNLVKNPGFENTSGKLKKNKSIAIAKEWVSPTAAAADLYSKSSKDVMSSAPANTYGDEQPMAGGNYAGIVMYSFQDKSPRTYVSTKLIGELKKGMKYCVSFSVSLADNCKYAVNNLGAYVHKKEMSLDAKGNLFLEGKEKTHVLKHSKNQVFSQSFGWETMCSVYEAQGGEEWITIGNFDATRETKYEKIPKRKGATAQQVPIAYYYIDEIKVFQLDSIQECQCEVVKEEKATVVYSEEFGTNKEFKPEDKVSQDKVYFDEFSAKLNNASIDHLNDLIKVLNEHPEFTKIEVAGHSDPAEAAAVEVDDRARDLAKKRVTAVVDFLEKGGIAKDRLVIKVVDGDSPATKEEDELSKAKNRRVEFKVVN